MVNAIGFLEPTFLWALSFLGVILFIHFLKRPRTVKLSFSTLRFFNEEALAANRSQSIRRILLLINRMLLCAILAMIFARPFLKKDSLQYLRDTRFDIYVWIDRTPSMEYLEKGVSLGEYAMQIADSVFYTRNNSAVFCYDQERREFIRWEKFRERRFSSLHQPPEKSLLMAFEEAERISKRPVFFILSDFQNTTSNALETMLRRSTIGKNPVIGCRLTPDKPWNAAITGAFSTSGPESFVSAQIRTYGVRVFAGSCFAEAENIIRTPAIPCTFNAPIDTVINIYLHLTGNEKWGSVALLGEDPLRFDNNSFFVTGRSGGFSVVIVGDERVNFPVAAALQASAEKKWSSVVRIAPEKLTTEALDSADLVIINGYRVRSGTLEMIVNSRGPKRQAFIVAAAGWDTVGGAEARLFNQLSINGTVAKAREPLNVRLPDTVSGLWRGFPSPHISEARVYNFLEGIEGQTLLILTNGKPFAVRKDDSFGRPWIIFSTPIGITSANNLCETAFYVPFLDRIAGYACREIGQEKEIWIAGHQRKNPWYGSGLPARLFSVDGTLISELQQQPVFTIESPGIYKIITPSGNTFLQIVMPDTLESMPDYRIPKPEDKNIVFTMTSPQALLYYLKKHGTAAADLILWLVFGALVLTEIFLREKKVL